jgi:parvulin-like peptidyl-prolyl isomerase
MTTPLYKFRCLLLLCLCLSACQNENTPLLKIGSQQVSLDDFRQEIQLQQADLGQLPPEQQKLRVRQVLSQLIDQELLLGEVRRRGIAISEAEMQQALHDLRGDYSATEYLEILRSSGQNTEHWMQQLRIRLLSAKVAASITSGKSLINDQQIEEYYLRHLDEYQRPEQLQASQMLFATEDEALKLRNRLLAGESFAELARLHSISPDRENDGDLGLFSPGQFPPEFDEILFNLTPGRVSQPVKSPFGIHLFLVEKRHKARVLPLTEVAAAIRHQLQSAEDARLYLQWLHELREKTGVEINWEQLDKFHVNKAE